MWLPLFALMCFPLHSAPSPGAWLGLRCFGCGWCLRCTISLLCPSRSFPSFFYWVCFLILVVCGVAMVLVVFSYSARRSWTGCLAFVFFSGLFLFHFLIPGRAHTQALSHTFARALALPLSHRFLGPACLHGFLSFIFPPDPTPLSCCPALPSWRGR